MFWVLLQSVCLFLFKFFSCLAWFWRLLGKAHLVTPILCVSGWVVHISRNVWWCVSTCTYNLIFFKVNIFFLWQTHSFSILLIIAVLGERCFLSYHEHGTKKNSEFPWGPPIPYHWTTETPRYAMSITMFIWHASCMLLRPTMLMASCL